MLGPEPQDPTRIRVDLRDVALEHLIGFDAVVHLAALSNDPLGALGPADHLRHQPPRVGAAGTAGQGRGRHAVPVRVHMLGVRRRRATDLVTEDAPLRPLTPYAESKVRVEDDVAAIADESFAPVFLRNATAFGFSPRLRADIVLNNLVGHAVLTGEVRVLSDGTPWRPLVHARDIAAAFLTALEAPRRQSALPCIQRRHRSKQRHGRARSPQAVVDVVPRLEVA